MSRLTVRVSGDLRRRVGCPEAVKLLLDTHMTLVTDDGKLVDLEGVAVLANRG